MMKKGFAKKNPLFSCYRYVVSVQVRGATQFWCIFVVRADYIFDNSNTENKEINLSNSLFLAIFPKRN